MDERYCMYDSTAVLFDQLAGVIDDNLSFFVKSRKPLDAQFVTAFGRILNVIEPTKIAVEELSKICNRFDVDPETKGNGFRSLIYLIRKCLLKILEIGIYIQKSRDRFFFRSYHNSMEIESYSQVISRLFTMTQVALSLGTILDDDSLFANEDKFPDEVNGLLSDFETIGRECFYGRSFGFQFSPALQQSLHVVVVALAAYGDGFKRHNGNTARALSSFLHSGKYVIDPELRAKRIVELTQRVSVPFCKSFWSLTENHGIQHVPMLIGPAIAVNRQLTIVFKPLVVETKYGHKIIDPPFLHAKSKVIHARLLSYSRREGQGRFSSSDSVAGMVSSKAHGLSKNLLIHCHGGGFVAQSSKSHEIYLRGWAKELQCPILSIDYSLAPDAPYPEALNECFYVYNWAIENCRSLGWTSERICLAGDSAGGNLIVALTLKLIAEGLRLPDGLVPAYPPLRVQYAPAPSRMLALMDPLLPPGILKLCLRAYAGGVHEEIIKDNSSTNSLRTLVFDDFYNPFDLDLGDVAYAARRRNESVLTGKRSYSDTNLVTGRHYCVSRPVPGCLKCGEICNRIEKIRTSRDVIESEAEDDFLQMHPIPSGASRPPEAQENDVTSPNSAGTSITESVITNEGLIVSGNNRHPGMVDRDGERGMQQREILSASERLDSFRDIVVSNSESVPHQMIPENPGEGTGTSVIVRRNKPCFAPNHRRSMSDSIAESFQRLHPSSEDFELARKLSSKTVESIGNGAEKENTSNRKSSPGNQGNHLNVNLLQSPIADVPSQSISNKTEYKALFIRETSECVIIDRDNVAIRSAASSSSSFFGKVEKTYERQESSDSITSSVRQASRDPFMSPLLASDEMLLKFPKLIIVACSLDPLLDDSIDFIRRMKKLQKDSEIFIVEDLPHGFLNFNFASSEARDANDLIVACIKRVLKIGLKHENSFPISPEGMKEDLVGDEV